MCGAADGSDTMSWIPSGRLGYPRVLALIICERIIVEQVTGKPIANRDVRED